MSEERTEWRDLIAQLERPRKGRKGLAAQRGPFKPSDCSASNAPFVMPLPIDFVALIAEMGLSDKEIVREAQGYFSESSVRAWRKAASPNLQHFNGELLIRIWQDATGKGRDQVPRRALEG